MSFRLEKTVQERKLQSGCGLTHWLEPLYHWTRILLRTHQARHLVRESAGENIEISTNKCILTLTAVDNRKIPPVTSSA